jgi:hypothetical protein
MFTKFGPGGWGGVYYLGKNRHPPRGRLTIFRDFIKYFSYPTAI